MTRQQIIDILEAYKPSGNIYNDIQAYETIENKLKEIESNEQIYRNG